MISVKNSSYGKSRFAFRSDNLKRIINFNFLRRFKIQTRLIASFLLLSILPLAIIGAVTYLKSSNAIKTKISTYSPSSIKFIFL